MHFFMHNPGGAGLYLPFNMMGWVFVSLLISVGIWHLTQTKQFRITSYNVCYTKLLRVASVNIILFPLAVSELRKKKNKTSDRGIDA